MQELFAAFIIFSLLFTCTVSVVLMVFLLGLQWSVEESSEASADFQWLAVNAATYRNRTIVGLRRRLGEKRTHAIRNFRETRRASSTAQP